MVNPSKTAADPSDVTNRTALPDPVAPVAFTVVAAGPDADSTWMDLPRKFRRST
jgi:hypothetical protein